MCNKDSLLLHSLDDETSSFILCMLCHVSVQILETRTGIRCIDGASEFEDVV